MFDFNNETKPIAAKQTKTYSNPIVTAKIYSEMIKSGAVASEAALARKLGISRARVNQIMMLLKLDVEIIRIVEGFGNPMTARFISERMLRRLFQSKAASVEFLAKHIKIY